MENQFFVKKLFDGISFKIKKNQLIKVQEGIIQSIETVDLTKGIDSSWRIFDEEYVMPGLIDCHVHLVWDGSLNKEMLSMTESIKDTKERIRNNLKLAINNGVTTVRDVGGIHEALLPVKQELKENKLIGARMITSLNPIVEIGGHANQLGFEVETPDEIKERIKTLINLDADLVKVMACGGCTGNHGSPHIPELGKGNLKLVTSLAKMKNKRVAAHAEGLESIQNVIYAEVNTIEHGNLMTEKEAEKIQQLGIQVVPTFSPFHYLAKESSSDTPLRSISIASELLEGSNRVIKLAKKYGFTIACGTDSGVPGVPHGNIVKELELMIEAGLSLEDALFSTTKNAALACGRDDIGTIEVGKKADFIVLKDNPLDSIQALKSIVLVIKEGVLHQINN